MVRFAITEHTNRVSWLSPICDSISDYGYCSRNGFERRESPKPDSFFEIISIDDLETLCLSTAAQGNMIDTDSYYENCHLNLVGLERLFGGEVHVSRFYLNGKTRDYAAYFPLDMFLTQMQDVKVEADI